jgi:hypothetical protein
MHGTPPARPNKFASNRLKRSLPHMEETDAAGPGGAPLQPSRRTLRLRTAVIPGVAMPQAHALAAVFAAVGIDGGQLFLTSPNRAAGLLVHFGVVGWVAIRPLVSVERLVWLMSVFKVNAFRAYWAHDDCSLLRPRVGASVCAI